MNLCQRSISVQSSDILRCLDRIHFVEICPHFLGEYKPRLIYTYIGIYRCNCELRMSQNVSQCDLNWSLAMVAACTATASNNIPPALHACSMIEMIDWADPWTYLHFVSLKHASMHVSRRWLKTIYIYTYYLCVFQYRFFAHREIIIL